LSIAITQPYWVNHQIVYTRIYLIEKAMKLLPTKYLEQVASAYIYVALKSITNTIIFTIHGSRICTGKATPSWNIK